MPKDLHREAADVRGKILETATALFYQHGIRAVGIDLIIEQAGVAKASLYRHFATKDDLIAAFAERKDHDFWATWDEVAARHAGDPRAELDAHLGWIGERAGRFDYRGCAQINVAAEFPENDHPARKIARAHKQQLRRRLADLGTRLGVGDPDEFAGQLALLINGALVSSQLFKPREAIPLLRKTADCLLREAIVSKRKTRS